MKQTLKNLSKAKVRKSLRQFHQNNPGIIAGDKHPSYGKHHSEETKKKSSELKKGDSNPMFGKHHSEETKQLMSKRQKGKKLSKEHKRKISETSKGQKHTTEHNKKVSEAIKKVWAKRKESRDSLRYTGENPVVESSSIIGRGCIFNIA